ncbi:hypothetical protein EB796_020998 [Bugula neritina]|uniref:Uncharacterized protein n=1 Tax=Bugula neritina TaxID=10212 RepID=A0A7J7J4V5_BUGNE|nr:hypothetical protein EB796_020998 [Bugula neritina]
MLTKNIFACQFLKISRIIMTIATLLKGTDQQQPLCFLFGLLEKGEMMFPQAILAPKKVHIYSTKIWCTF